MITKQEVVYFSWSDYKLLDTSGEFFC